MIFFLQWDCIVWSSSLFNILNFNLILLSFSIQIQFGFQYACRKDALCYCIFCFFPPFLIKWDVFLLEHKITVFFVLSYHLSFVWVFFFVWVFLIAGWIIYQIMHPAVMFVFKVILKLFLFFPFYSVFFCLISENLYIYAEGFWTLLLVDQHNVVTLELWWVSYRTKESDWKNGKNTQVQLVFLNIMSK